VQAIAKSQGISTAAVATIGDMQNDLAMFKASGVSIAMGNATDDIKKLATHVTTSNEDEGFAGAVDIILQHNEAN
jgi:hydroxymethylpyrimidine pyrophosphatase-like HAD family hydrolase